MVSVHSSPFLFIVLILLANLATVKNQCTETCGHVQVQFPFQLRNSKLNHTTGYPGFNLSLSCTHKNETLLELPGVPLLKLLVKKIDYQSQEIEIHVPDNCLPRQLLTLVNSSISPFQFKSFGNGKTNVTFFQCPWRPCPISLTYSEGSLLGSEDIINCTKMHDALSVEWYDFDWRNRQNDTLFLNWLKLRCKLKNNVTQGETECFICEGNKIPAPVFVLIAAGVIVGFMLLVLLVIALLCVYRNHKMKGKDHERIEKFLEDYRAMKPTRFTYADVKRITNGFKDSLGEGVHGAVFKGMLSQEIHVAVKILNDTQGDGKDFINEVGTMGKIHHVNVVRLLGFCADGFHRALVYDFFPNGSLQKFLCPPDNKDVFLGWEKLQQIALGVARGIEYLHLGCDHRILHFDINPHNVLLDVNFTPKITDFGLSKLCPKNQSTVSITAAKGTLGYIAPEVFSRNFGNVSYKSDIYSYGMLLLEMVGGRKNTNMSVDDAFQVLYPEWIYNLIEGRDISIDIEDEEDIKIAKKLAIVGLWCIQWNPVDRPSMKTVVQMLEGEGDKLKAPPAPFDSTASTRRLNIELEVIHELE